MFDLLPSQLPPALFPLAVLLASLVGSWHCAGMCGPIACGSGLQGQLHAYHFGRLCSYTLLGLIAGGLGQSLMSEQLIQVRYSAGFAMGLLLVSLGMGFFFEWNWPEHLFSRLGSNWLRPILPFFAKRKNQKFLLGFFTALLPCGWLYSFVLVAAATKSFWLGAITMMIFWVGTVPALMMMSAGFRRLILVPPLGLRRIFGVFLLLAGIYSIFAQFIVHDLH